MRWVHAMLGHLTALHDAAVDGRGDEAGLEWRPVAVLVSAAAIVVITHYYGSAWYFTEKLAPGWIEAGTIAPPPGALELYSEAYIAVVAVALWAVVPAILALVFGLGLTGIGLGLDVTKLRPALLGAVGTLVVALPVLAFAASSPEVQEFWPGYRAPLNAAAPGVDVPGYGLYWLALFAVVLANEVLFRGYLTFGLYRTLGPFSVVVAAMATAMLHMDGPVVVVAIAFAGAIVLGLVALTARSIWPAVGLHFAARLAFEGLALTLQS